MIVKDFILVFISMFHQIISSVNTSVDCTTDTIDIIGGGGQFSAAVYQSVGELYATKRSSVRKVSFSYNKVNSAYGVDRITMKDQNQPPLIFAGVEITLEPEQKEMYPELITFPTLAGSLVMIYNLPDIMDLKVSIQSIAYIYLGIITQWNDPIIQQSNPNISLPAARILPVARMDNCGESLIFTSGLTKISEIWNSTYGEFSGPLFIGDKCCNSTKWPPNVISFYGNRGVGLVGIVSSIPYTIGYISKSQVIEGVSVTTAKIINAFNRTVSPNDESIQIAMDYALSMEKNTTSIDHLEMNIINMPLLDAYPLASFSYMIVNRTTHLGISCCQMEELTGFLDLLYSQQSQSIIQSRGLVPLSANIVNLIYQQFISKLRCKDNLVYQGYQSTLVKSTRLTREEIIIISVATLFGTIGAVVGAIFTYLLWKRKIFHENSWLLTDIQLLPVGGLFDSDNLLKSNDNPSRKVIKSQPSISGDSLKTTYDTDFCVGFRPTTNYEVLLMEFPFHSTTKFKKTTKVLFLKFLKEIQHHNLIQFLGISEIDKNLFLVNQSTVFKNNLHHTLKTSQFQIDKNIQCCLAIDVVSGLKYLHQKNLAHGTLSSLDCYLTSSWSLKIGKWEFINIYLSEKDELNCNDILSYNLNENNNNEDFIKMIYKDPAFKILLKTGPPFQSDIYSLGMLLVEIFTRKLPVFAEIESDNINAIKNKFDNNVVFPTLHGSGIPMDIQSLVFNFIGNIENRPDIFAAFNQLKPILTNDNKMGIVDLLMNSIEVKLSELTTMTTKMKGLLNDVLPPQIAEKLFNGEQVAPEFFDCCTIFFSDIVGFTTISAKSTPTEVMALLNEIYTKCDTIIENFDVYKIDTIGDAYMVASGLPLPNGVQHCNHVCLMALHLMQKFSDFAIPHLPLEKLQLRMGINSGPVTAGIIGRKMPQYCVFGDTVNTACRMESTSLPGKIQVSESTYSLCQKNFSEFIFQPRGEIDVKGKGKMECFWLVSCNKLWRNETHSYV